MQNLYREWSSKVDRRKGRMVPLTALSVIETSYDPGYMSVYMFSAEDAYKITQQGNSQGFDKYAVHSDTLYIDIDSGQKDLDDCLAKLNKEGLGYYVYASGSKGHHVVIPLDTCYSGNNVPHSQLEWVRTRGIRCDFSLYRHGSLISMPGRVHPKTGQKKRLVHRAEGKRPQLILVDAPAPTFSLQTSGKDSLPIGLAQLTSLVVNPPSEGGRHLSIWKTSKSLAEAGLSYATALDLMQTINASWPSPKSDDEVQRAVESAYA